MSVMDFMQSSEKQESPWNAKYNKVEQTAQLTLEERKQLHGMVGAFKMDTGIMLDVAESRLVLTAKMKARRLVNGIHYFCYVIRTWYHDREVRLNYFEFRQYWESLFPWWSGLIVPVVVACAVVVAFVYEVAMSKWRRDR